MNTQIKSLALRAVVSLFAVSGLVLNLFYRHDEQFSRDELILMAIAVTPWLSEFITSFKVGSGGVEVITKRLDDVEKKATAAFDASVHGVAKSPREKAQSVTKGSAQRGASTNSDDPNHGRFGQKPKANGRTLSARVEKIPGEEFYRRVILQVKGTRSNPLKEGDKVKFHLHPTFDPPIFDEVVRNGVASTTLVSYGAFTVGVETDNGVTRLELDLTSLDDGDDFFDR